MKKELLRKAIHLIFGTIFLLLIYYTGTINSLILISIIFILGLIVSIAIKKGIKLEIFTRIINLVERDYEKHWPGKAALLFFIAAIILLYFFRANPIISLAGLATVVYGDAAAALIGKRFGKIKIGYNNSLEGTLACFFVCLICINYFFPFNQYNPLIILIPALLATIAEYLPINDNLAMPLGASSAIYFLLLVL